MTSKWVMRKSIASARLRQCGVRTRLFSDVGQQADPRRMVESAGRRCGCWSTSPFLFGEFLFADSGSGRMPMMIDGVVTAAPAAMVLVGGAG